MHEIASALSRIPGSARDWQAPIARVLCLAERYDRCHARKPNRARAFSSVTRRRVKGRRHPMRSKATLFCTLLVGLLIAVFAACNRTAAVEDFSAALVELRDEGTIAWNIRADGTVAAMIKSRDDKPITANVSGKIATGDASSELTQNTGSGVLEGKGLKLGTELTRAKYDLVVRGTQWSGT